MQMAPQRIGLMLSASALLASCATQPVTFETIEPEPAQSVRDERGNVFKVHLAQSWYPFRAAQLGITVNDAVARDEAMNDAGPPDGFWDQQTATEAAAIWGGLCNDCHGGRRSVARASEIPAPPPNWGRQEGLFFGRKRSHGDIFEVIQSGGEAIDGQPSEMPAWGPRLSREQIWSLVYYIEHESRGILGDFPPGLYPEQRDGDP